jgi:hypothetical protein
MDHKLLYLVDLSLLKISRQLLHAAGFSSQLDNTLLQVREKHPLLTQNDSTYREHVLTDLFIPTSTQQAFIIHNNAVSPTKW